MGWGGWGEVVCGATPTPTHASDSEVYFIFVWIFVQNRPWQESGVECSSRERDWWSERGGDRERNTEKRARMYVHEKAKRLLALSPASSHIITSLSLSTFYCSPICFTYIQAYINACIYTYIQTQQVMSKWSPKGLCMHARDQRPNNKPQKETKKQTSWLLVQRGVSSKHIYI